MSDMIHPMGQISAELSLSGEFGLIDPELEKIPRTDFVTVILPNYPDDTIYTQLVNEARRSYLRYGEVPLTDSYDESSIVGLAAAIVDRADWEIVTLRMVPFVHESRIGTEDSEMFELKRPDGSRTPIIDLLRENGIEPRQVASMSRLAKQATEDTSMLPITFAHLQVEMCREARAMGIDYLISQQHRSLDRRLRYNGLRFPFCDIAEFLKLSGEVSINRDDEGVWSKMSLYPGYFLSGRGIIKTLKKFDIPDLPITLEEKEIGVIWSRYVKGNKVVEDAMRDRNNVPDASFLSIAALDEWESAARAIINQYEKDYAK